MQGIIGIDLGTTNSCVAVLEDGRPRVIPYKGTYDTMPSMVAVGETGRVIVGHLAKRQAVTNLTNTAYAFKRLIGRSKDSSEVRNLMRVLPYRIVPAPTGDVLVQLQNSTFSIPELSSMILREMKESAERYLGHAVTKAVITVPAYFADAQRQATKEAGRLAGLEVLRVINEPTAAALAYGIDSEQNRRIAVYDLGGGTFDISVLDIGGGVYRVLATGGDSLLGGEDFDQRLMDWVVLQFARDTNVDLREDKMALQRVKDAVERAKCDLSEVDSVTINLPFIVTSSTGQPLHLNVTVNRAKLEELTSDLVERTIRISRETLESGQITLSSIDEVVLVGGQTRMPLVRRMVTEFFGREPIKSVHPDHVVAMGAAIQAHSLVEHDDLLLLDVTSHSLGIKVAGGRFYKLIHKNTTIPTHHKQIFTTVRDYQDTVRIVVLQGESDHADDNQLLGEFLLTGIRKAPKGEVDIEVDFNIDADGIVTVSARDVATGREQSMKINKPVIYGESRAESESQSHGPSYQQDRVWGRDVDRERQTHEDVGSIPDSASLRDIVRSSIPSRTPEFVLPERKPRGEDVHERETVNSIGLGHSGGSETHQEEMRDTMRTPSPFLSSEPSDQDIASVSSDELFSEIFASDLESAQSESPMPFMESEDFSIPDESFLLGSEEATPTPEVNSLEYTPDNFSSSNLLTPDHDDYTPTPELNRHHEDEHSAPSDEQVAATSPSMERPHHIPTRELSHAPYMLEMMSAYEEIKKLLVRAEPVIRSSSYGEEALENIHSILHETEEKGMMGHLTPQEIEGLLFRLKRTREMLRQIANLM